MNITKDKIISAAETYVEQPHYDDNGHKGSFIAGAEWAMKQLLQQTPCTTLLPEDNLNENDANETDKAFYDNYGNPQ